MVISLHYGITILILFYSCFRYSSCVVCKKLTGFISRLEDYTALDFDTTLSEKKNVNSGFPEDISTRIWEHHLHGCTARRRPHNISCSTNGHISHSMSTRHQSPGTSHPSSRHRSLTGKHTRHQASVTRHRSMSIDHQSPGPGTSH